MELYASGNIVLTDGNYEIIALLRSHKFEDDISVQVGEIYPIAFTTTVQPLAAVAAAAAALSGPTSVQSSSIANMNPDEFVKWTRERYDEMMLQNEEQQRLKNETEKVVVVNSSSGKGKKSNPSTGAKKQRVKKMNLRQLLLCKESGVALFGPEILDHCLLTAGLNPSTKVEDFLPSASDDDSNMVRKLLQELHDSAPGLLALLDTPGQPGYILIKKTDKSSIKISDNKEMSPSGNTQETKNEPQGDYYDFVPRMFKQHQGEEFKEMSSFDEAVDEYFCKVR